MKIRLYANTVRLRLSQREVGELARGAVLREQFAFLPQPLTVELSGKAEAQQAKVQFSGSRLAIAADRGQLERWAATDEVSIRAADADSGVGLLIEKDFQCLHGDGESQPDCFPNPLAAAE